MVNNLKNFKLKLLKTNATIWFNNARKIYQLTTKDRKSKIKNKH
jgi:hypothetical protein